MADNRIKLSVLVKATMLTRQEILRARALDTDLLGDETVVGMIQQHAALNVQMQAILKGAILSLFMAFVAWSGGNISIPGTGATIAEVPAFFEISLVGSAFCLMFIPYIFLSTQIYEGMISVLIKGSSLDGSIDSDMIKSSKMPVWLFIKYMTPNEIIGRKSVYQISKMGIFFNLLTLLLISLTVTGIYLCLNCAVIYLAIVGLTDSLAHSSIFIVCCLCIFVAAVGILANLVSFSHKVNHDLVLEEPDNAVFASDISLSDMTN